MVMGPCFLVLLLSFVVLSSGEETPKITRDDFPSDFVFGAGSSAYQYEGAVTEDGKTPSVWDIFTHDGNMPDKSTGDIACDGYHKYKEDAKLMSDIGLEAYRFSISWARLLPKGRGAINPKGLEYYNNLIDDLLVHGIQPHVTLFHPDLPQILENEYLGWLSPRSIEDFTAYADVCFREFGDRVSHWTTFNEPNIFGLAAYGTGQFPPQRCSPPGGVYNCSAGNSSVEPYTAVHHILLAHASTVSLYREKYQVMQHGLIGLNVYGFWLTPKTNLTVDVKATQRATDFYTGWVIDPVMFGDYPAVMKKNAGTKIPSFTKKESKLLKGSFDFIGINHYIAMYIEDDPCGPKIGPGDFNSDMDVKFSVSKEDTPPGPFVPSTPYNPSSIQSLLEYFKDHYGNPPTYIHENGYSSPYSETCNDTDRVDYLNGYIKSVGDALSNGANIKGYFVWSFLDVFELLTGYEARYGIVHVDFEDKDLKRQPKLSAQWYSDFLKRKTLVMNTAEKDGRLSKSFRFSQ